MYTNGGASSLSKATTADITTIAGGRGNDSSAIDNAYDTQNDNFPSANSTVSCRSSGRGSLANRFKTWRTKSSDSVSVEKSTQCQHDGAPKHSLRGSIGQPLQHLRKSRSRDHDEPEAPNSDDLEHETIEDNSIYDYSEAAPSRRRNSLGDRFADIRKDKRNTNSTKCTVAEMQQKRSHTGYEDPTPSQRRSSLGERIKSIRTGKARNKGTNDDPIGKQGERSLRSYEEAGPSRCRRNSLTDRIKYWTGAVNNAYLEKSVSQSNDLSHRGSDISGEADEDKKTNDTPHRRSSLADRIMVWAGAINEEHCKQVDPHRNVPRRSSIDFVAEQHCSEDADYNQRGSYPEDDNSPLHGRTKRRNSLHAMVERAVAFANLKPEQDDELCAFGTRRDSLF